MNKKKVLFLAAALVAGASWACAGSSQPPFSPSVPLLASGVENPAPPSLNPALECDSAYRKGDCNRNGRLETLDVVRLLNAVYVNSDGTFCNLCLADMNCDKILTGVDAVWFLRYFYAAGTAPRRCP